MKTTMETGWFGRTVSMRVGPNEDITEAIEQACREHGLTYAMVRGGIGSLSVAAFVAAPGQPLVEVTGIAIELLTLVGEVRPGDDGSARATLCGSVGDPEGRVFGGRFVRGANPVCVTMEIVLQEWVPTPAA